MLGVKLEPAVAALVRVTADEEGRSVSTYLYRLIKADLNRRAAAVAEAESSCMPAETPRGHLINVRKPKLKRKGKSKRATASAELDLG